MLLRLWESINSYKYDERMLHLLSKVAEMHVVPEISDPHKIAQIPDDAISDGETRPNWSKDTGQVDDSYWPGLYKSVGIFTDHEWNLFMCKCLASMGEHKWQILYIVDPLTNRIEISLADGGSLTTGPTADNVAGFEIGRLPKPQWRIGALLRNLPFFFSGLIYCSSFVGKDHCILHGA